MTRPMSEEREKLERALETARWIVKTTEANPDSHAGLVARALLSTSDDLAKANECWRKSRQYNDTLRRELDVARAAERGMREALEKIADRMEGAHINNSFERRRIAKEALAALTSKREGE